MKQNIIFILAFIWLTIGIIVEPDKPARASIWFWLWAGNMLFAILNLHFKWIKSEENV